MDNLLENRDILILGGGPSGLSTALHLQQLRPDLATRILILEKARYPRLKLCAGGLVADAEVILARLGLDAAEVPHVDARAARFDFAGKGLTVKVPRRHTLRIIRRDEFDAWLAGKARERGLEIREQVTVKDVHPDADGVTVITDGGTFRAKVVVGADGSNGVTRRCVLPNAPVSTARVLEVLTPVIASEQGERSNLLENGKVLQPPGLDAPEGRGLLDQHLRHDKPAVFDFFCVSEGIAGYTWDFPTQVKGEPRRCWGIYDTNLLAGKMPRPALKQPLAKEMFRHGFELDGYEIKGHPIRWYDPTSPLSVPRVLLVGDAAGADPLFGEGISMALGYGKLAAQEIGAAFRHGDFSFSGYRRRVRLSSLGQTLLVRWVIAQVVYRFHWRWFQILLWRILKPVVIAGAWVLVLNWGRRLR